MMGFRAVFIREVQRMPRFKGIMTLFTLLPVLLILFFVSVFTQDTPSELPVAVVDFDNSSLSRRALRMVDATPSVEIVANAPSVDDAKKMMMRGEVSGVLVLPKGMERKVYRGEGVDVPLFVGGEKILNSSLIYKDVFTALSTLSAGIEIQYLMKGGLSADDAYQKVMPIYYEKHQLFNPYTSYSYFLLPGFLLMLVSMFAIVSAVFVVGVELKRGTSVEWIQIGGGSIFKSVIGKLLPYTIIYFTMQMFVFVIMFGYLGQPMNGNAWFMLFSSLMYVVCCQSFGLIVISLFLSLGLSTSISAGFSIMAFSFSGLTFPIEALYGFIAKLSNFFPYKHFMRIFVDNSMRGADISLSFVDLGALAAFAVVAILLMVRLKCAAVSGKYKENELEV